MKLLDIGMNFVSFLCSGKCINRCKMTADIVNQHPLVFILLYQCAVIFCHIGFFLAEKLHLRVFLLAFLILYAVISLVINLLDHVICFPVVRTFDGLLGGLFGLVRGLIVAILLLSLVPSIITLVSPEVVDQLIGGSSLYKFIMQLDFVGVSKTIARLIG